MKDGFFEKGDLVEHKAFSRRPRVGNVLEIRWAGDRHHYPPHATKRMTTRVHVEWDKGYPRAGWYAYHSLVAGHPRNGNCWEDAYKCRRCHGKHCDVCHKHDQPRGECDDCPRCPTCDRVDAEDAAERASTLRAMRYPNVS